MDELFSRESPVQETPHAHQSIDYQSVQAIGLSDPQNHDHSQPLILWDRIRYLRECLEATTLHCPRLIQLLYLAMYLFFSYHTLLFVSFPCPCL